ncbi:unnamed protein product [Didymodactylos carnosus]|uniref:Uncharacterized protein n=1 Tax=Didymodactylos carnosus TaxID=1234261 RepID=A0A814EL07_9BILA|nr:unnamed protein product [Didymodactylos carnosus]CAF0970894.1 unnamed protein product [Didymodactylos carnosus]CAF3688506.1 unnamed protein product [Didymodactylos carnosus]CAF3743957.1 unnamed protein product [Didymodactylos carnosus]
MSCLYTIDSKKLHGIKPKLPFLHEDETKNVHMINKISSNKRNNLSDFLTDENNLKKFTLTKTDSVTTSSSAVKDETSTETTVKNQNTKFLISDLKVKFNNLVSIFNPEILELYNQFRTKPVAGNDTITNSILHMIPDEQKHVFNGSTNKLITVDDNKLVMDQLRTMEYVQLQAIYKILQQQNKKLQTKVDQYRHDPTLQNPHQLLFDSVKKQTLDKPTFCLLMEKIIIKTEFCLDQIIEKCLTNVIDQLQGQMVNNDDKNLQPIENEIQKFKHDVKNQANIYKEYCKIEKQLTEDIFQLVDLSHQSVKTTKNFRQFVTSLYDASYAHRLQAVECKILKRQMDSIVLGFFHDLVHLQLVCSNIGNISTWATYLADTTMKQKDVQQKLTFVNDDHSDKLMQFVYSLLKKEITSWNIAPSDSLKTSFTLIRKLIQYGMIANNLYRTLGSCLESFNSKLDDDKFTLYWTTKTIRLDIAWILDERLFQNLPLTTSYCCQPQHNGICDELEILLGNIHPTDGSLVLLYDQVNKKIQPWLSTIEQINEQENKLDDDGQSNKKKVKLTLPELKNALINLAEKN